jgi:hypothetical protein
MKDRILTALFLVLSTLARSSDGWKYFHPENVSQFGCVSEVVQLAVRGQPSQDVWKAGAYAHRNEEPDWAMTVGFFPPDQKGRHQAEKACSKWMDEAIKRVKAAAKSK